MLVNCTNHPFVLWGEKQKEEALHFGEIVDFPFPSVPPDAPESQVSALAQTVVDRILPMKPDAVLCQGEMTCTFKIVSLLKDKGIPVFAATSERVVDVSVDADGISYKNTRFCFCRFRAY